MKNENKLEEDYNVVIMKWDKYEQELDAKGLADKKIDIESLDGRINFLVNTLEEYRRILEEDSAFGEQENECLTPIKKNQSILYKTIKYSSSLKSIL